MDGNLIVSIILGVLTLGTTAGGLWVGVTSRIGAVRKQGEDARRSLHHEVGELKTKVAVLETVHTAFKSDVESLKSAVDRLGEKLDDHMEKEPLILKDIINTNFRQVISEELRRVSRKQ